MLTDLFGSVAVAIVALMIFQDDLRARLRRDMQAGIPLLTEAAAMITAYLTAESDLRLREGLSGSRSSVRFMTKGETTGRITGRQFLSYEGIEDWRPIFGGGWACAYFRTGSFETGVALVGRIGALAAAADHHPDIDLRPEGVTVRLFSGVWEQLSKRDVELARQISAAARELDAEADSSRVQHVQVAIDATAPSAVAPFWRAVLGYDEVGAEDVVDSLRRGPTFWFQQMDTLRPQRNRIHIDVYLPHDQVEGRIAAAVAAGGRVISDKNAPEWWTLADPEGNEVDLAIWMAD